MYDDEADGARAVRTKLGRARLRAQLLAEHAVRREVRDDGACALERHRPSLGVRRAAGDAQLESALARTQERGAVRELAYF